MGFVTFSTKDTIIIVMIYAVIYIHLRCYHEFVRVQTWFCVFRRTDAYILTPTVDDIQHELSLI